MESSLGLPDPGIIVELMWPPVINEAADFVKANDPILGGRRKLKFLSALCCLIMDDALELCSFVDHCSIADSIHHAGSPNIRAFFGTTCTTAGF